jgi:hypothetical protein
VPEEYSMYTFKGAMVFMPKFSWLPRGHLYII